MTSPNQNHNTLKYLTKIQTPPLQITLNLTKSLWLKIREEIQQRTVNQFIHIRLTEASHYF